MSKQTITLNDKYHKNLRDSVGVSSGNLRGEVGIYEKSKSGSLKQIGEKKNMIVYGGREWLMQRAFGSILTGSSSDYYNKTIRWFGIGNGGGESGNPLQAGATQGQDTTLLSPVRLRSDMVAPNPPSVPGDPGYYLYASDYLGNHGYYKTFSSVIIRQDNGNPYVSGGITTYPNLIAEIRIELTSDDATNGSYEDLNEAALFVSDSSQDPGKEYVGNGGSALGNISVVAVSKDSNYSTYYLNTTDLVGSLSPNTLVPGNYMYVTNTFNPSDPNQISQSAKLLIVDVFNGTPSVNNAYVVVDNSSTLATTYVNPNYPMAYFVSEIVEPYIMFSRVTFSSIRKTVDRELVFLWKIYF